MARTSARLRLTRLAALVAVALLTFAGVKSNVMQVAEAMGAPAAMHGCGMDMGAERSKPGKAHKVCGYCVAAAHAPLTSCAAPAPVPTVVAYAPPAAAPALGPRGPPATAPRARGPPPSTA